MQGNIYNEFKNNNNNIEKENSVAKASIIEAGKNSFQKPSMSSLVSWNISKALEKNPHMDLKTAIKAAQDWLESDARDLSSAISQCPEEQHLVCALLAWQQLGHDDTKSLLEFIESQRKKLYSSDTCNINNNNNTETLIHASNSKKKTFQNSLTSSKDMDTAGFEGYCKGPVVKLPVKTNIVMRLEKSCSRQTCRKRPETNTKSKIEAACCMDSVCADSLAAMDTATNELRARVTKLGKREAQRVELLERAEAAWRDLELGYQRRLALAEEKEDDLSRQIQKAIEDRNANKNACTLLAKQLCEAGDAAEKEQVKLKEAEKELCGSACVRLKLSEEVARGEATIADLQCKLVQLDRDLQYKEEQARRKLILIDNETESARLLTCEAERALRAELSGLRQQIEQVSVELLEEDEVNKRIKVELEQLRQEKMEMVQDLDGCKVMCDSKMQAKVEELKEKRQQLEQLKEKVIDCQCKMPMDAAVTVKRTPSLAALCKCAPEDRLLESCSCTSLRGRLISNLLADLFGGLQSELGGAVSQMPCELLKCLEDKHNWDRSSVVKTNLRNFFSKLLVGELDIAIATSIENYHVKWVGASCADAAKMHPDSKDDLKEGWEQRALEKRAQKLAEKLAEKLFEERAEELTKRAKEIVTLGPPPCMCDKSKEQENAAVLSCITEITTPFKGQSKYPKASSRLNKNFNETQVGLERTQKDVTELKLQVENLKKKSIKKEDLKVIEEKIAELVKQAMGSENENYVTKDIQHFQPESNKKMSRCSTSNKTGCMKKKVMDTCYCKNNVINEKPTKLAKKYNHNQSYAVNLCLCGPIKANKTLESVSFNAETDVVDPCINQKPSKYMTPQATSIRHIKHKNMISISPEPSERENKSYIVQDCDMKYKCLHEISSTTSLENLLKTLAKWKHDLENPQEKVINDTKSRRVSKIFTKESSKNIFQHKIKNSSKVNFLPVQRDNELEKCNNLVKNENIVGKNNQLFNLHQAVNTASIYMAAINLEKSNEFACKSVNTEDVKHKSELYENSKNVLRGHTHNKISLMSGHVHKRGCNNSKIDKVLNEHLYDEIRYATNINVLANTKSTKNIELEEAKNKYEPEQAEIKFESEYTTNRYEKEGLNQTFVMPNETNQTELTLSGTTNLTTIKGDLKPNKLNLKKLDPREIIETDLITTGNSQTNLLPKSFDYYIKFLGVKLTDIDSKGQELIETKHYSQINAETPKIECNLSTKNQIQLSDNNLPNTKPKCECNVKCDELQSNIINICGSVRNIEFQQNDKTLNSKTLRYPVNTQEQCVCCNNNNSGLKDLEENAFYLLEDHLKQKLEEFKICACKASCILPEEEEKIFAAILKKVRQVISNYANEMKCTEPQGSWNRAYGFLKEYLITKIERVQGIPFSKTSNDSVLPEILKKVCNLIESDFQRLKHIYKCKKSVKVLTDNSTIEHLSHSDSKELVGNDTNNLTMDCAKFQIFSQDSATPMVNIQNMSCQITPNLWMKTKSCDAIATTNSTVPLLLRQNTQSKQNSIKSLILTQNVSAQVSLDLVMVNKPCNLMEIMNKNEKTTDRNCVVSNKESIAIITNYSDCYPNPKKDQCTSEVLKLCRNKEILLNLYADVLVNCDIISKFKQTVKQNFNAGFVNSLPNLNDIQYLKTSSSLNQSTNNSDFSAINHPYFDCTVHCTYDDSICTKSISESNNYEIYWKKYIANRNSNIPD